MTTAYAHRDPSRELAATVIRVLDGWRIVAGYAESGAMPVWSPLLSELTDRERRLRFLISKPLSVQTKSYLMSELRTLEKRRVSEALRLMDEMLDQDACLLLSPP